jgi:hypothetical protein
VARGLGWHPPPPNGDFPGAIKEVWFVTLPVVSKIVAYCHPSQRQVLYRLTPNFQNRERTARRFVIEHSDRQPPSIPSEGVKVGSVLF